MDGSAGNLLFLGLLLVCGLSSGLVASRFGLPRIAAYVLTGVVFSRNLLGGVLDVGVGAWTEPLTTGALGMIAYLIGGSISVSQVRRVGGTITVAALGAALGAVAVVFGTLLLVPPRIAGVSTVEAALAFGVIASSTAPAGTIAVVHQFRARGPLTTALLGVVAIDDAIGVVLFALMVVVAVGGPLAGTVGMAILSLAGAVALGLVAGKGLALWGLRVRRVMIRLPLVFGVIVLVVGGAEVLGLSSLLAGMAAGFFARFFSRSSADRLFLPIEFLEETIFVIFFTVAGAHFEPALFVDHVAVIAAYFVARIAGKVAGAYAGARAVGAPPAIVRWLGLGLVPQAGVAIGLALLLSQTPGFTEGGRAIVNIVLGTTLLYEILGPFATRLALERAGELGARRAAPRSRA